MIKGILLAAGSATRFGGEKLLHALPDGTPIAVAAARNLVRAVPDSVAVIRPWHDALFMLLRGEGLQVTTCADAHLGMGASLAHGVAQAAAADGWVIALADMPAIRPETIAKVARAIESGAAIAAPVYQGQRGHPVGFGAELRNELLALDGDQGARAVLECHRDAVKLIECDDPGVLYDIDRPADIAAA